MRFRSRLYEPLAGAIVAHHNRHLKPKTLRAIIEQAGLTEAEFLDLL